MAATAELPQTFDGWSSVRMQIVAVITLAAPMTPWATGLLGSDSAAATTSGVYPARTCGEYSAPERT